MNTKHTPGPWEVVLPGKWRIGSGYGVQARTPEGPGFPTPSATGYYAMCEPPPHGMDKKSEQEANARLIASAPDLLAALQTLTDHAQETYPHFESERGQRDIAAALAAIAKAEGRV